MYMDLDLDREWELVTGLCLHSRSLNCTTNRDTLTYNIDSECNFYSCKCNCNSLHWTDFRVIMVETEYCYNSNVRPAVAPHAELFLDLGLCHVLDADCFDYLRVCEYFNMKTTEIVIVPPRSILGILVDMWIDWLNFVEYCFDSNVILAVAPRPYLFSGLDSCHFIVDCFDHLSASEYGDMKLIRKVILPPRLFLSYMWI